MSPSAQDSFLEAVGLEDFAIEEGLIERTAAPSDGTEVETVNQTGETLELDVAEIESEEATSGNGTTSEQMEVLDTTEEDTNEDAATEAPTTTNTEETVTSTASATLATVATVAPTVPESKASKAATPNEPYSPYDQEETEYVPPRSEDPLEESKAKDEEIAGQWHKEDWANKTPQELEALALDETDKILHDKYVPLVATAVALVCFSFMLVVVQQLVENPNGCLSKACKCTVACLRILSWPIRMILCCGLCCGSSSARQPDHHILGSSDYMSKSSDTFEDAEFV